MRPVMSMKPTPYRKVGGSRSSYSKKPAAGQISIWPWNRLDGIVPISERAIRRLAGRIRYSERLYPPGC